MKPDSYIYNRHSFAVTVEPTAEPVSVQQLKDFLKIDNTDEDGILNFYIQAARKAAENYTGKSFITQTRTLTLDWLPSGEYRINHLRNDMDYVYSGDIYASNDYIDLPFKPIQSVSSVVTYDTGNNATTYSSSNYVVDTVGGRIVLNYGSTWMTNLRRRNSIVVTYVAGYGASASSVPYDIQMAVMQYAADMYNCRTLCDMSCECMGILNRYRNVTDLAL